MAQNIYKVLQGKNDEGDVIIIAVINTADFGNKALYPLLDTIIKGKVNFEQLNPNDEFEQELIDEFPNAIERIANGKSATWETWEFEYTNITSVTTNPWTARDQGHVDEITTNLTTLAEEYNLNLDEELEWLKELKDRIK